MATGSGIGGSGLRTAVSLPHRLDQPSPPPYEYEPQLTPEQGHHDGYETSDTFSDDGYMPDSHTSSPSYTETATIKLEGNERQPGRKPKSGVAKVDDSEESSILSGMSPTNSLTSLNSISSLLKEKLMLTLPRSLKKRKKPKEYKLRSFVAMLFIIIVFLVGFAHIFYHQQILQRAYFDNIRFNKDNREVRLFNAEKMEIALGNLGSRLAPTDRVYDCLPKDQKKGSICFEWMHQARLYIQHQKKEGFSCYMFTWYSLHPETLLTDCYKNGSPYGHWYGGGRTLGMAWPVELGKVDMSPFVTGYIGKHRWGSVLKRYFINSKGVAIYIDPETPLYVSINAEKEDDRLCLQARHDDFAYVSHEGLPKLNYSICSSDNMKLLHSFLSEKSLWDGLREADVETINYLLSEPVWQIAPAEKSQLSEQAVLNYTDDVIALGFLGQGHVLLNEHWQSEGGDFLFDQKRFPTMEKTIEIIQRRGFRIALTIQPFIGTESNNFADAVKTGLLIREREASEPRTPGVPALTKYKSMDSAGMIDITNNQTIPWLQKQLTDVSHKYQVDSFYLDMGTAYDMPHYYQLSQNLTNPDHYKTHFTNKVVGAVSVMGVSGAVARPPAPVFVSLPLLPSTWKSLQVIIPTILTYGIVGYPFLMPGPVGGDYCIHEPDPAQTYKGLADKAPATNSSIDFFSVGDLRLECDLPEKELYMRWLQLATFLPVIRYSNLPSDYDDANLLDQAKTLTALREKVVTPLLKKYAKEALDSGAPLIRPLWMLDPADTMCHFVVDEFSVGDELIVAPVLHKGVTEREVYLPAGVWKDGLDSSLRKGSRSIHNYKVPMDKIAYFIKMPDNTRF